MIDDPRKLILIVILFIIGIVVVLLAMSNIKRTTDISDNLGGILASSTPASTTTRVK